MTDLIVDYDTLRSCKSSLDSIHREFDGMRNHQHDMEGFWGSGDIKDAMNDFAGNWDYHKKKLQASIEAMSSMVDTTVASFQAMDRKLKDELAPKPN